MDKFIFSIVNLFVFSIILYYIYLVIQYISFKSKKDNTVYVKKYIDISHITPLYFLTSLISIITIYYIFHSYFHLEIGWIVIPFIFLYTLISLTHLIPKKIYFMSKQGIFMINPQFSFSNCTLTPFKKWNQLNIKNVINEGDYFYIEVIDKKMGKVVVSLYYTDYYQIEAFK